MAKIARKTRVGKVIIIGNPDRPRATIEIIEVRGRNVSFVYRGEYSIEIDDIPDSLANHWKTRHNSRETFAAFCRLLGD